MPESRGLGTFQQQQDLVDAVLLALVDEEFLGLEQPLQGHDLTQLQHRLFAYHCLDLLTFAIPALILHFLRVLRHRQDLRVQQLTLQIEFFDEECIG